MWAPLALAEIDLILRAILRTLGSKAHVPTIGQILGGWALPAFSAAVRREEQEAEAKDELAAFESLARKLGATVTKREVENGG